jgi:hypothetical protein
MWYQGNLADSKHRDALKRQFCAELGITLIEIPYTWDRSKESIRSQIIQARPDLSFVMNES